MMQALDSQGLWRASCVTVVLLLSGIFSSLSLAQESHLDLLRPGDAIRLQLSVAGEGQSYDGEYAVDEMGMLSLPLIGTIRATDRPAQQLRQLIINEYQSMFRNQAIQVTLLRRISVLGAVRTPGLYLVDPTMRISDVVATAGGVTPDGRPNEIRVLRNGQELLIDLTPTSPLPAELRSGDQLYVPERSWLARNGTWVAGVAVGTVGMLIRLSR